jgi:hypothetical protein
MPIELPCNIAVWVQHYPGIVLPQANAEWRVNRFADFVFKL